MIPGQLEYNIEQITALRTLVVYIYMFSVYLKENSILSENDISGNRSYLIF